MKKTIHYLIIVVLIIGICGTFSLVRQEFTQGEVCPKLLGIPACFIILSCFLLATIGHLLDDWVIAFYLGVISALLIASYGSLGEIIGFANCPKTSTGIPMCYISFGIFGSLLFLKIASDKIND